MEKQDMERIDELMRQNASLAAEVAAEMERLSAVPDGFREIVEAVAHIGVDFGYGNFDLSQEHIEKTRALLEAAPFHSQQSEEGEAMTDYKLVPTRDDLIQCLLATRGQSEGVTADAILSMLTAAPDVQGEPVAWRDVPEFEGLYEVSSHGDVRNSRNGKIMSKGLMGAGYVKATLYKEGVRTQTSVHRLVAMAFLDNPESFPSVNHLNGVKTDNRVVNLEWCSRSHDNLHRCYELGKGATPIEAENLSTGEVILYPSITQAARDGFESGHIYRCIKGEINQSKGWTFRRPAPHPAERQSVLNLSEAARSLGVAQEKGDQGAIDYWSDMVTRLEREVIQPAEQQPECGCCGQTVKCDDDCDAVVLRKVEQQPAPDVSALVEVLESAKNLIANHSGEVLPDEYAGDQIEQIDAALAAYRKKRGGA